MGGNDFEQRVDVRDVALGHSDIPRKSLEDERFLHVGHIRAETEGVTANRRTDTSRSRGSPASARRSPGAASNIRPPSSTGLFPASASVSRSTEST